MVTLVAWSAIVSALSARPQSQLPNGAVPRNRVPDGIPPDLPFATALPAVAYRSAGGNQSVQNIMSAARRAWCEGEGLASAVRFAIEQSEMALQHEQQIQALGGRHGALSRREREVMMLVAAGFLNKQVGHELGISEITVKCHRGRMMRKMQARSLAELVTMVASLQLSGGMQSRGDRLPV